MIGIEIDFVGELQLEPPRPGRRFRSDELGDGWNQAFWNHHHCSMAFTKSCFVFGNRFVFGLLFVMTQKRTDSLFIPTGRKSVSL